MYKKVIIVDDEITKAFCLKEIISWNDFGLTVTQCFRDAEAALDYIRTEKVDVIFSDIRMPRMDGIEFCKTVHEKYPHIVFIFVSAYSDFEYAKKAIEYRVFGYITKPIDISELEETCNMISKHFESQNNSVIPMEILQYQHLLTKFIIGDVSSSQLAEKLIQSKFNLSLYTNKLIYILVSFEKSFNYLANTLDFSLDKIYALTLSKLSLPDIYIVPLNFMVTGFNALVFSKNTIAIDDIMLDLHKKILEINKNNNFNISLRVINQYDTIESFKKLSDISGIMSITATKKTSFIPETAIKYIEANYMNDISLLDAANYFNITPYHLCRVLKKEFNTSFNSYLTKIRMEQAQRLLAESEYTNNEICEMIGLNNNSKHFYQLFKSHTGMTPSTFRKKHREENF